MADNKSLQECLAFVYPAKGFDERALARISAAANETQCERSLSLEGVTLSFEDADFDELANVVESGAKLLTRLHNGNWVAPLGLKYERGEVADIELFDPLASGGAITVSKVQFCGQWSGCLLLLEEASGADECKKPGLHGLVDLVRLYREYQRFLGPILFAGFLASLLSLASPFFLMLVLDKVVSHRAWSTLTALVLGAIFLIGFESLFDFIRAQLMSRMTRSVGGDASGILFRHTALLPTEVYEGRPVGGWINDNRQSERFVRLLRQLSSSSVEYAFAFLFLAVLLWLSWLLTAVAVVTCLLQIGFAFHHGGRRDEKGRETQEGMDKKESLLVETLAHLRTLKTLGLLGRRTEEYRESVGQAERLRQEKEDGEALVRAGSTFIERAGNIVMLSVGVAMVMQSSLTVGALMACNLLMRRMTGPLARLPSFLRDWRELKAIQRRWQEAARVVPPVPAGETRLKRKLLGAVELKKVYFRYARDSRFQVMIDAQFPPGETVAVVGKSGAGKTTLVNLLLGLHVPQVGLVCMDGSDLRELDLEYLRQQIGVVSHDVGLFRGSVRYNISSWDSSVSLERIQAAAKMACLHEAIQAFPRGYDTIVGDDGANLSSGQKSRLSLARALAREPALLLLDEVTGDLDPATERTLVGNIIASRRGRTTVFFTHSEFVASQADVVFYMEDGRFVASGKHDRLNSENASYRNLWGRF